MKKTTSPAWYLAALGVVLIGWVTGVAVAGSAWDTVRAAPITSATEALQAEGESIAVFTDVIQTNRRISCVMNPVVTDNRPEPIAPAPIALSVEDDGTTWHLIAFQVKGRDGVTVTCTPRDRRVDNAQYAVTTVAGFLHRARIGNAVILATVFGGAGIALAVFLRRRREQKADP